jgi:hypothetical protein
MSEESLLLLASLQLLSLQLLSYPGKEQGTPCRINLLRSVRETSCVPKPYWPDTTPVPYRTEHFFSSICSQCTQSWSSYPAARYSLDQQQFPFPFFSLVRKTWSTQAVIYKNTKALGQSTALMAILPR